MAQKIPPDDRCKRCFYWRRLVYINPKVETGYYDWCCHYCVVTYATRATDGEGRCVSFDPKHYDPVTDNRFQVRYAKIKKEDK